VPGIESPPLTLGIIGAGAAVRNLHWPILKTVPDQMRIVAVANRSRATAEDFAVSVGSRVCDDYQALLGLPDVDAVLIAVPIAQTAAIAAEAIRSGKHVMIEKPLAASADEAVEIVRSARRSGRIVAVAENFRYRDDILRAKAVIESGQIGRVVSFHVSTKLDRNAEIRRVWFERPWRRKPQHPGGILLDAGVHAVAGLREVLGDVSQVYAQIPDYDPETGEPASLLMQLTLNSGAIGHYSTCYRAKVRQETIFDISVLGDQGSLELREGDVNWLNERGPSSERFATPAFDRGYRRQWQNFLAAVRGQEPIWSTVEKAYGDLRVIEAGLRSAQFSKIVRLDDGAPQNLLDGLT
jgi:predicted dehydrogenase